MKKWGFNSWENFEAKHLPEYNDKKLLDEVKAQISSFPPLIFPGEVKQLKKDLTNASLGKGFILQAGDCAESFTEFNADNIKSTFQIILQMGIILTSAINLPVTKIGRIAGQFAKPRSNPTEIQGNEYILGLGYRVKDLQIRSRLGGSRQLIKSDLNMKADFSVRNNKTIVRYLDLENNQVTSGQTILNLKYSADYAFSQNLTGIFYFDYSFSEYAISTAFPQTTIRAGFTMRYNFGN